MGTQISMFFF